MSGDEKSLEVRMAIAEERIKTVTTIAEAFGPTARQVIEATAEIHLHTHELAEIREAQKASESRLIDYVQRVERACSALGTKLDTSLNVRIGSRATIIAALVGVAGIVIGKVIG
jgi:DNA repair ATPase RecN